ncbi:MAG: hypothetical protein OEZ59_12125 [Deltaproteobacteria bacterium]|nr:hypothetical protein [Deltaproteobacteria bacterium]
MFGLGLLEAVIILVVGYYAFRHIVQKRYPNFNKAFDFIFIAAILFMLLFGWLARH